MRPRRARPDMADSSFWQGWQMGRLGGDPRYGELGQGGVEDLLSKTLTCPHLLSLGAPGDVFAFPGPQVSTHQILLS